jgi:hypothetical protein
VGFCGIFKHFSGFGFFLLPSIVHARPHAGNANRWAVPCIIKSKGEKVMKKSIGLVFLAFVLLTVLLSGCAPASTPVPPTLTSVPPTDTPIPTATSTKPPTSTPIPPTPTLAPPSILSELIDNVIITSVDNFDNIRKWETWNSQTAKVSNGVVEIQGQPEWNGGFVQLKKFGEGTGVVIEFKNTSGKEYSFGMDTGEWNTDTYRSFGVIYYVGNLPRVLLTQGKNNVGSGSYLNGNLSLKKDTWYGFAIAIGKDADLFSMVWDLNDPSHRAVYHEKLNDKWIGKTWKFLIQANTGTSLNVDNFSFFSFSGVK